MDNTELARIAYDAYRAHTGGVSLATGQPIPEWPQLRPEIQAAWQASAEAVKMAEPEPGFWGGMAARMQIEQNKARTEIERLRGCVISAMIDFDHGLPGTAKAKLSLLLDHIMKTPRNNEERLLAELAAFRATKDWHPIAAAPETEAIYAGKWSDGDVWMECYPVVKAVAIDFGYTHYWPRTEKPAPPKKESTHA